jgi:3-isopropylmalate/(R)-2-methylmalate dehydratase small subunit
MKPINSFSSKVFYLPQENIDTDQIIPARFIKTTNKEELGKHLFANWRYQADGTPNDKFILNLPEFEDVTVLIAGNNFGCGSSREHAVWALIDYGFKVIISTEFGDIFQSNAIKNGLLTIQLDNKSYRSVINYVESNPHSEIKIDLDAQTVRLLNDQTITFQIDGFTKYCLVNGINQLDYLLNLKSQIETFEKSNTITINTEFLGSLL